jgi:formylmethanofuran dehydrogenase subunit A
MPHKGHLGVGADADVTIYHQNPDGEMMFRYPRYVIKAGEVVVEEGEIRKVIDGREFVVRPAFDQKIEDYLRPLFQQVYTMSFDNYPVELERLHGAQVQRLP